MTYSGSRMLRDLARNGQAPEFFGATTKKGLPLRALLFDAALMGTVVILNYFFEGKVFAILLAIIVGSELITWASISFAHLRFRANGGRSSFMAPFYPYANWLCAGFYVLVLVLMAFLPDYRVGLGALIAWVVGLSIIGATRKQSA